MKLTLTLLATIISTSLFAAPMWECQSDRVSKSFSISEASVVTLNEIQKDESRGLASVFQIPAHTRVNGKSVTKIMNHEGLQYTIHLSDFNSPSDFNDTVSIKNERGHEITYPLNCK